MYKEDLIYSLDPAIWASETFGIFPDPWQVQALRSTSKQQIWNIHRQAGKSTVAALKCLHRAVYSPGSLILLVSKAERQSYEVFRKVGGYYDRLESPPSMVEDRALDFALDNKSRIISLPGAEDSIRGYSSVDLIFEDESARVPDDLNTAVRPMLAVSNGTLILASTPYGKNGHFAKAWNDGGPTWERIKVTADKCSRISKEFLEEERRCMSEFEYLREYFGEFTEPEGCVFSSELFRKLSNTNLKSVINMRDLLEGGSI